MFRISNLPMQSMFLEGLFFFLIHFIEVFRKSEPKKGTQVNHELTDKSEQLLYPVHVDIIAGRDLCLFTQHSACVLGVHMSERERGREIERGRSIFLIASKGHTTPPQTLSALNLSKAQNTDLHAGHAPS